MATDYELIQRFLRGDREALATLVESHLRQTYAVAYALTGSASESEDLVQETFLRAFRGLSRFRRDGRFAPWLTRILRNAFADRRRRESRERRVMEDWRRGTLGRETPELVMKIEREEAEAILEEAVRALPEGLRAPLLLYYVDDLDANRVADRLGLHPATARKRIQRARDRLRGDLVRKLGAAVPFLAPAASLKDQILMAAQSASVLSGPGAISGGGEGAGLGANLPVTWPSVASRAAVAVLAISAVAGGILIFSRGPSPSRRSPEKSASLSASGENAAARSRPAAEPPFVEDPEAAQPAGLAVDISGSVIHAETDAPIAGAQVLFHRDPSPGTGRPVACVETGADGGFHLRGAVSADVVQLFPAVTKDGFQPYWVWHQGTDPRAEHALDPIRLRPGIAAQGLVLLPEGRPAQEGNVWAVSDLKEDSASYRGQSQRLPIRIQGDGRFTAWVSGARAAFLASVPGFLPAWSDPIGLTDPDRRPVVIRVEARPKTVLTGFVCEEEGRPIEGAEVGCSSPDEGPRYEVAGMRGLGGIPAVRSDPQGFFRIEGVSEYPTLHVSHPEYVAEMVEGVVLNEAPVRVVLSQARWLTVRIEGAGGVAFPISVVELRPDRGSDVKLCRRGDTFRSSPLSPGAGRGRILIPGHADTAVEWPDGTGECSLGTIRADPGIVLTVKVIDTKGMPIEGANVQGASTDSSGEVRLSGLEPGSLRLRVRREGFAAKEEMLELASEKVLHECVLDRGASLTARFVDPEGRPENRVWTTLLDPSEGEPGPWFEWGARAMRMPKGTSGSDGLVEVRGIPPGKTFLLAYRGPVSLPGIRQVAPLEDGEARDLGEIAVDRGGVIRGAVRGESGKPLEWAAVALSRRDEDGRWWGTDFDREVVTDAQGRFQVSGVPEGIYRLSASKLDHVQRSELEVPLGRGETRDVEIVLSRSVTLAGRITYEDDSPLRYATIWLDHLGMPERADYSETVDRSGRFLFQELPADGPVRMTVVYGSLPPLEVAEAAAADQLPRLVRVPHGADLVVEVQGDGASARAVRGRVKVGLELPRPREASRTLAGGQARFSDLPDGRVSITVEAEGFLSPEPQASDLVAGMTQRITFGLIAKATQSLTVRVRAPSGEPAPGAEVQLVERPFPRPAGITDDDGLLVLSLPEVQPDAIQIFRAGFAFLHLRDPLARVSNGFLDLVLAPESAFVIQVNDARGAPVRKGIAQVQSLDGIPIPRRVSFPRDIGRGGIVRLGNLAAGHYRIAFGASGSEWGEMDASIGAGEERALSFEVPPSFEIRGRVFLEGLPATGGRVGFLFGDSGTVHHVSVDADGAYTIPLRRVGTYRVTYSSSEGNERIERSLEREIAGACTLDLDF
ncbi:MAG: sigma-70 family RNA polymerase sigma factor [Planctomycetes bacterium]|nr:sigma-70 family RNA polymerase sigma factor [Planctomycetota bacterium]